MARASRRQRAGYRVRGEICIGTATFFSFVAVILLIFAHVGQINTSTIPRDISMAKVNISTYGAALHTAIVDPVQGLYTTNFSAPLEQHAGLRQFYLFGLYSHCAFTDKALGLCSNVTTATQWTPFTAVVNDMPTNYSTLTLGLVPPDLTFVNSHYLGEFTRAAYYLLLMGTVCAGLAMLIGLWKRTLTYVISTSFAVFGTTLLLMGVTIWTVIIHKAQDINSAFVVVGSQQSTVPLGITVSTGAGLWLFWGAFISLFLSMGPYMIACCTYRG
ncbi:hypothetical protein BD410DRAFT_781416 [Rickenella mellea]|uniref:Actin cortical patch SUR7/pH-response regulator pali n=1 Tax=Rickenella mellea TaxID=50990 RepID=A0A4Y7QPH9_9AGAM|nr:hypothetical protein BD410DRAFT_781416 [Rickenella mellea]